MYAENHSKNVYMFAKFCSATGNMSTALIALTSCKPVLG